MRTSDALRAPNPEAYRPSPAVLRRVHGLRRHKGKLAAIEPLETVKRLHNRCTTPASARMLRP